MQGLDKQTDIHTLPALRLITTAGETGLGCMVGEKAGSCLLLEHTRCLTMKSTMLCRFLFQLLKTKVKVLQIDPGGW